jgi:phosphate-transporting ATPase
VRGLARPGLQPLAFDLAGGECLAVRGPSGAGKSLLLRALADLDPNDGELSLDGRRREAMPAPRWRRLVTYLPAEPGWWAETVGAHFADWLAAEPLVEALVRALVQAPRVLLLDEPTAGLDETARDAVERLIARHLATGAAALWVTHDAGQARRLARRCLRVEGGRVTEDAP